MFFSLTELEQRKIQFDVTYQPGEIQLSPDLRQITELRSAGSAELLRNTLGEIRVRGDIKVTVSAACDRCLEPAMIPVNGSFDLFYRPVVESDGHHEHRISDGEVDLSFYNGDGLRLEDVLREHILLQVPMQIFCRENCLGICPVCGENRNLVDCQCEPKPVDERWAALKDLQTEGG